MNRLALECGGFPDNAAGRAAQKLRVAWPRSADGLS